MNPHGYGHTRGPGESKQKYQRKLTLIGTSSIVDEKTNSPILSTLSLIVETVAKIRNVGHRVILVSSGAVGVGTYMMNIERDFEHHSYLKVSFSAIYVALFNLKKYPFLTHNYESRH